MNFFDAGASIEKIVDGLILRNELGMLIAFSLSVPVVGGDFEGVFWAEYGFSGGAFLSSLLLNDIVR